MAKASSQPGEPDRSAASRKPARQRGAAARTSRAASHASLTSWVCDRLRADILSCTLEPGREISEGELAVRFEVSKTPVREALAILRAEGLVRSFPRRSYQITPISLAGMHQLFDVRAILEAGAAELACEFITEDELQALERYVDINPDFRGAPERRRYVQANRAFHMIIAQASANKRLTELIMRHLTELERYFHVGAQIGSLGTEIRDDHRRILAALRRRDAAAARQAMSEHSQKVQSALAAALAANPRLIDSEPP